jgi:prepilin-type N-terminal cleavage/methylation domain-containing protein
LQAPPFLVRKLLLSLSPSMEIQKLCLRTGASRAADRAFTLTEVLIASAILMVVGATAIYALTTANKQAVSTRVRAAAQSVVQNQIDQILTRGPYLPAKSPPEIPAVLQKTATIEDVPVFVDPESGRIVVSGTLTTAVEDSGASASGGTPLHVLKAAVTLNYKLAGKPHAVVMNTLRAPDQ